MSLPGLQLSAPVESSVISTIHELEEGSEWRFEVGFDSKAELLSGSAEIFGTELATKQVYIFTGTKAAVFTWHGCRIEVVGECLGEYIATETPCMTSYVNLHFALERLRDDAEIEGRDGPRVLVLGLENAGKTSLAKLLTAYATRSGRQPIAVNLDPKEGMLSIPGSLSATSFSSIIDVEEGWGSSPTNGPSQIPVKLPLVYFYGKANPKDFPEVYKPIVTQLALSVIGRLGDDPDAKGSGCIIDTPGSISDGKKGGYDIIQHIMSEFSINVLVVVGSEKIYSEMSRRFSGQKMGTDENIAVIKLDSSGGNVARDEEFLRRYRQAQVREYFFGDPRNNLSPHTQQIDFGQVNIYKIADAPTLNTSLLPGGEAEEDDTAQKPVIEKVQPSLAMQNGILAIMHASANDTSENIRDASVIGFLFVAEVDEKRRKMKILVPLSGPLPGTTMIWGSWPEDVGELVG